MKASLFIFLKGLVATVSPKASSILKNIFDPIVWLLIVAVVMIASLFILPEQNFMVLVKSIMFFVLSGLLPYIVFMIQMDMKKPLMVCAITAVSAFLLHSIVLLLCVVYGFAVNDSLFNNIILYQLFILWMLGMLFYGYLLIKHATLETKTAIKSIYDKGLTTLSAHDKMKLQAQERK